MRKGFFPRLALSGIRKNRSIYYPYILTAVLTTAMMYIIGSLQNVTTDYSGTLAFSLQLGIVVTSIFSVIFLFYTNSFLMRRRKKEFGLYNILAALDSRATDSLLRLFGEINEDGQTILMVTHSVKAASHATRVMFIKDGEVFHQLYRGLDGAEGLYQRISDTLTVIATGGARHA